MKIMNPKKWGTAVGAGLLATVLLLPQARGELVYENDATDQNENSHSVQVEDRSNMRKAIGSSQKMQVSVESSSEPAQSSVTSSPITTAQVAETQSQSKSELMRRERTREELKNEDVLQERLEALRLRDERRRLDQMFAANGGSVAEKLSAQAPAMAAPLREEVVVAPVTERPGTAGASAPVVLVAAPVSDSVITSRSSVQSSEVKETSSGDRAVISVAPHAGLCNIVGQGGYFDVRPRYAAGIAAEVSASENFSFEMGYTFNEYGVAMASTNPFVLYRQQSASMFGAPTSFENVVMKQNVLDAGLKVHVLGGESRLRPFVGGGGAYSKGYINFDPRVLGDMNRFYGRNVSPDYEVSSFLGYVSSGLDVRVAKGVSVGAEFKYYAVLSARESDNFSSYYGAMYQGGGSAFMPGYQGVAQAPVAGVGSDTAVAGGSLARSSFYSILGSVTFTF